MFFSVDFLELARKNQILLFQEIVLHPKSQPIHNDRHDDYHQNELQSLVRLDPPNQKHSDRGEGSAEQQFSVEEEGFGKHHHDVPHNELHQPVEVAYAK